MNKLITLLALVVILLSAAPSHAQTTATLAAPATVCVGSMWPINCNFNATDPEGNPQSVHVYLLPNAQEWINIGSLDVTAPVTSYASTLKPGDYFPSTVTIAFQGGAIWDGEEYIPVTGTATLALTYARAYPHASRYNPWIATATLVSMKYTY
jgi:hypothetical protein